MTYRSLLLSYFNIDTISYQGVLLSTVIVEPSHVVTLTHSTIQNGWTALKLSSNIGHLKVVELLLRAGANPDLQDKVRTEQDSCVHANLSNGRWYVLHPVKPGAIVNSPPRLVIYNYIADCKLDQFINRLPVQLTGHSVF